MDNYKFIHLLYVPTMACNMGCRYCYLEDLTVEENADFHPLTTLKDTIHKLKEANIIPFNISLHGGEVTTLAPAVFTELIAYIDDYYRTNRELLESAGFKVGMPHIKTNLYDLERHLSTIRDYRVSISGSLDLPFVLHDDYRVTKGGDKTLSRILENIELLRDLPNHKKVSATIFHEHYEHMDEIVNDIRYLHQNTCLDMNDFNFMIGFDYQCNGLLTPMSQEEQVLFFRRMHQEFDHTELDVGVNGAWFNEFGPEYCTNCTNCGEKFFLLERNGDIYSCVRGQKNPNYFYGNIFSDSVSTIMDTARQKIYMNHNRLPFSEECGDCAYLYLCKTGCPFVKNTYRSNQSYTCKLQQELYQNRGYAPADDIKIATYEYTRALHPEVMKQYYPVPIVSNPSTAQADSEPTTPNSVQVDTDLPTLIRNDGDLQYIYAPDVFVFEADGVEYPMQSQILRKVRDIVFFTKESRIRLRVKKHLLSEVCQYPNNNALYLMCLSGDLITYGDEQRTKQAHLFTHQIFKGVLDGGEQSEDGEWYIVDLSDLFRLYGNFYAEDKPNNFFVTTAALRDYHYLKQKNNAFYHIQAINLPFQNIEFYYINEEVNHAEQTTRNI